jgi:hypothetical protein
MWKHHVLSKQHRLGSKSPGLLTNFEKHFLKRNRQGIGTSFPRPIMIWRVLIALAVP